MFLAISAGAVPKVPPPSFLAAEREGRKDGKKAKYHSYLYVYYGRQANSDRQRATSRQAAKLGHLNLEKGQPRGILASTHSQPVFHAPQEFPLGRCQLLQRDLCHQGPRGVGVRAVHLHLAIGKTRVRRETFMASTRATAQILKSQPFAGVYIAHWASLCTYITATISTENDRPVFTRI